MSKKAADKEKPILVSEIFGPTLQGEGAMAGVPTVFVRTGGCDFMCSWCDSLHAVDAKRYRSTWAKMTTGEVLERVYELSDRTPLWITLSGGNPALQPLGDFVRRAHVADYKVAMETQGSRNADWLPTLDHLILSPKPPSSGMKFDEETFNRIQDGARRDRYSAKVVVFDEDDYQFAKRIAALVPQEVPFFITPGNATPPNNPFNPAPGNLFVADQVLDRTRWLADRIVADRWFRPRIIPQIHTLLWANELGR